MSFHDNKKNLNSSFRRMKRWSVVYWSSCSQWYKCNNITTEHFHVVTAPFAGVSSHLKPSKDRQCAEASHARWLLSCRVSQTRLPESSERQSSSLPDREADAAISSAVFGVESGMDALPGSSGLTQPCLCLDSAWRTRAEVNTAPSVAVSAQALLKLVRPRYEQLWEAPGPFESVQNV